MKWPRHEGELSLTHNAHKSNYATVAAAVVAGDHGYTDDCWISNGQRAEAIETNECWTLQWYPDTPVGFCIRSAADLDALLESVT